MGDGPTPTEQLSSFMGQAIIVANQAVTDIVAVQARNGAEVGQHVREDIYWNAAGGNAMRTGGGVPGVVVEYMQEQFGRSACVRLPDGT